MWCLGAVLVALAVVQTPTLAPDSQGYIEGNLLRSALVPLLLRALRVVFSPSGSLRAFDGLQAAIAFVTTSTLAAALSSRLRLDRATTAIVWCLLGAPQWQAATTILSESLAYSLLSLCLANALPLLWGERSTRALLVVSGAAALVVLTRPQFVYLVPIVLVVFAWYLATEPTWAARARLAIAGTVLALGALGIQALHTYPRLGHMEGESMSGWLVLTVTTAVATEGDVDAIADPEARAFESGVWHETNDLHELASQGGESPPSLYSLLNYNSILYRIPRRYLETHAQGGVAPTDVRAHAAVYGEMNALCLRAARDLAKRELLRLIRLDISQIMLWERYMNFVVAGLLALTVTKLRRSAEARLVFAVAVGWIINLLFVVALEPPNMRYTFYFDAYVTVLVVIFIARALRMPPAPMVGAGASPAEVSA